MLGPHPYQGIVLFGVILPFRFERPFSKAVVAGIAGAVGPKALGRG